MVEKFEDPIAAYGDLSYEELQALIAIIGRLFRSGRKTEADKPLMGSTAEA